LRQALARDVPAFLCSADDPKMVEHDARSAGFQGCWSKPVDLPALMAELQRLGGGQGAAE
jgi:CheY-like chemotaxis protein